MNFLPNLQQFLCPRIDRSGACSLWPVRFFVHKNFNIGHIFWLVRVKAFIFHMSIPCDKSFLLVPSSRSSVKVKYQGLSFREKKKGCCSGISFSQIQLLINLTVTTLSSFHASDFNKISNFAVLYGDVLDLD